MSYEGHPSLCIDCQKEPTLENPHRFPLGTWSVCLNCLHEDALKRMEIKKGIKVYEAQIAMIEEGLYLGNEDAALDVETINKYNIQAICVCGNYLLTPHENIEYLVHNIFDYYDEKILPLFPQTFKWINEQREKGKNVLVHCSAGVSRSASFIIGYLMQKRSIGFEEALEIVRAKRKVVNPNLEFRKQLKELEKTVQKGNDSS